MVASLPKPHNSIEKLALTTQIALLQLSGSKLLLQNKFLWKLWIRKSLFIISKFIYRWSMVLITLALASTWVLADDFM